MQGLNRFVSFAFVLVSTLGDTMSAIVVYFLTSLIPPLKTLGSHDDNFTDSSCGSKCLFDNLSSQAIWDHLNGQHDYPISSIYYSLIV